MSQTDTAVTRLSMDTTFKALASRRRRQILAILSEHRTTDPLPLEELVRSLVDGADVDADAMAKRCRIELVHCELPLLQEAGLLSWNREEGTITIPSELSFDVSLLELTTTRTDDTTDWDALFSALADGRRRLALSILAEADEPLPLETLTATVAERGTNGQDRAALAVALRHQHLPLLEEAGVVTVDDGLVTDTWDRLEESVLDVDDRSVSSSIVVAAHH